MQKLTKAQAQWLIEKIEHDFGGWSGLPIEQFMPDLKRCINQCTEGEFPIIHCSFGRHCDLVFKMPDERTVALDFNADEIEFSIDEFKEFTKGCVSICQWLDEQNA